MKINNNNS